MSVNKEAALKTLATFCFFAVIIAVAILLLQNYKTQKSLNDLSAQIENKSVEYENESVVHTVEFVLQRKFTDNRNEWGYLVSEGGKTRTFNLLDERSDFRKYYDDMTPGIRYRCPARSNLEAVFKDDDIIVGECKVVIINESTQAREKDKDPKGDMDEKRPKTDHR